jgi:hypothetical protein
LATKVHTAIETAIEIRLGVDHAKADRAASWSRTWQRGEQYVDALVRRRIALNERMVVKRGEPSSTLDS